MVQFGAECAGAGERFTVKYYQKLLILLALMWGFVGIQRVVVSIIMPAIQADMKLTYTDVGMVVSVTGLVWAFGALFWSMLGDRFGRRRTDCGWRARALERADAARRNRS